MSSGGQYTQALDLDDLQSPTGPWKGANVYARAKRAQVVLAREWAKRLGRRGVAVHAMHPGWADTPGVAESLPQFRRVLGPLLRTPAQGADTIVWLASADEAAQHGGGFWLDRRPEPRPRPLDKVSDTDAARLWTEVVRLTNTAALVPALTRRSPPGLGQATGRRHSSVHAQRLLRSRRSVRFSERSEGDRSDPGRPPQRSEDRACRYRQPAR